MRKRFWVILFSFFILGQGAQSQLPAPVSIQFIKKDAQTLPDEIINIPFFIRNQTENSIQIETQISKPEAWSLITQAEPSVLKPSEQKFSVVSIQIPSGYAVGNYNITVSVSDAESGETLAASQTGIKVNEVEKISLQLVESPGHVLAGEKHEAKYLLTNEGNTDKNIFLETSRCDVEGTPEISLSPGESKEVIVFVQTSEELTNSQKHFCTVRALLSGEVMESISQSMMIFPVKNAKKDLFFRYPVTASATYLATNQDENYQSAWQFELAGSGSLDPAGKHQLEFLARGPNSSNLSFLGLYDQYYISYASKNLELTVGEQSYSFTPLTESSRFGLGVESKFILNNGLAFGYLFVKPRFYSEIQNEMAFYSQFEKDRNNKAGVYYVRKNRAGTNELTSLMSISAAFQPFEKTTFDLEASRGFFGDQADNAFRANLNTQLWIFRAAGNYFYAGKNYPGYYNNSTFYSGSFSAQLSQKINVGLYARQDFTNAQLDTFFVTAPYSKSLQTFLNYNIGNRSYLKIYLREYERKDRLALEKFHYKTRSANAQFRQKLNRFEYTLLGEYGKTTNFLLGESQNSQNTYRGTANLGYRFSTNNAIRIFGSYSNINSFVSGEQRNVTAGLSASSQLFKNLKANFHLQNAYDIEDYYRNRNLMQLHLDYNFLKNHSLSFRSYYTLFRRETEDPEFFLSATYTYKLGVPVKQIIQAGAVEGQITNDTGEPVEGIVLQLLNQTTLTDKNGRYRFETVQPGLHLLSIDRLQLEINELPSIPQPIQVEVIEDRETTLNFRITEGAKLTGQFTLKENDGSPLKNPQQTPGNIIIELKSEFEEFRITTDENGAFSFPLVLPGRWAFRIYGNSVPSGFETEKLTYNFDFEPGEKVDLQIDLKRKKRNIIFKSDNISLSTKSTGNIKLTNTKSTTDEDKTEAEDDYFYTVQVGAFSKPVDPESSFFKGETFDFEKQIDNLYKYYIGRFDSLEKAVEARKKLEVQFKGAFVVAFDNGKMIYIE
jgi:hypothetical protein